jgi:hypothetical protein
MNNHRVLLEFKASYYMTCEYLKAIQIKKMFTICVRFEYSFEMYFITFEVFGFMEKSGSIALIFCTIRTIFLNLTYDKQLNLDSNMPTITKKLEKINDFSMFSTDPFRVFPSKLLRC